MPSSSRVSDFLIDLLALTLAASTVRGQCRPQWLPGYALAGTNDNVFALTVLPDGSIVVGGRFYIAGDVFANAIARWDGSAWSLLGSGVNDEIYALLTMPNGDVIAGGQFSSAGGVTASNIARWNGTGWLAMGAGLSSPVH